MLNIIDKFNGEKLNNRVYQYSVPTKIGNIYIKMEKKGKVLFYYSNFIGNEFQAKKEYGFYKNNMLFDLDKLNDDQIERIIINTLQSYQ